MSCDMSLDSHVISYRLGVCVVRINPTEMAAWCTGCACGMSLEDMVGWVYDPVGDPDPGTSKHEGERGGQG